LVVGVPGGETALVRYDQHSYRAFHEHSLSVLGKRAAEKIGSGFALGTPLIRRVRGWGWEARGTGGQCGLRGGFAAGGGGSVALKMVGYREVQPLPSAMSSVCSAFLLVEVVGGECGWGMGRGVQSCGGRTEVMVAGRGEGYPKGGAHHHELTIARRICCPNNNVTTHASGPRPLRTDDL